MSGPLLRTDTSIVCPVVGRDPEVLDLAIVYQTEQRVAEIAFVTPLKAPELLARFNEAYLYVHKHITLMEYELVRAKTAAGKIKAVILLDKVPQILEAKGLSSSADVRNAILAQDDEYQEAMDMAQKLECIIQLLKGKMEGFEWAFTSVKKIISEGTYNMLNPHRGSGTGDAPVGLSNPDPMKTPVPVVEGWGKARYNND